MIYNILIYLIQPFIWIKLLWNSIRIPAYRYNLTERYGFYKQNFRNRGIILHSVSIGEIFAAAPLVHSLQKLYPDIPITITTMTPTGIRQAKLIFGNKVSYSYLPYDLPGATNRFIKHTNPMLVIIMETEIWPNLINSLYYKNIPCIIANARLSIKSFIGYKKIRKFFKSVILNITLVAAQNQKDGLRFMELGLKKNKLAITGNLKFEIHLNKNLIQQSQKLREQWNNKRPIWIAASTHYGEEKILLNAHKMLLKIFPNLLMILTPRHPERFTEVKKITAKAKFKFLSRSSGKNPSNTTQVIINDTMGELMLLYGIADLAFIGGSLVKHGGHNPLEAAAHSIPIIMGPHILNFQDICIKLTKKHGLITINNVTTLTTEIHKILKNKKHRLKLGFNANKFLNKNKGSLKKLLHLLKPYLTKNQ
ncbi:lipid IV(A) 3-deoxy-D-manno-octulosonic acid transferase [Blochmannia endosymbiont of Colobopsis nipponica]|uniref:lipid IV(A) 3-deoxy-D-manno-octulosonic acid transferase n=1 Tax=Blochmannia endosymbiont of Colobopsis nipponica TaxID=2681987 RepID=UPI0017819E5F|nr:lipid IV(A) 3-deoxy-D-manno-octulosonic acid transferase [Blochmannia endosymbiont of Colobopsis nipponica]QOI10864.1 lipid IV(A) 3-deoxy-D-manno-octulosonic acid transferase [Blochmannia endosymbiont of Colobopsis nipponica]